MSHHVLNFYDPFMGQMKLTTISLLVEARNMLNLCSLLGIKWYESEKFLQKFLFLFFNCYCWLTFPIVDYCKPLYSIKFIWDLIKKTTCQSFKHIMKELQGAIIIASAFQALLGYSGLMSLFLRYDWHLDSSF